MIKRKQISDSIELAVFLAISGGFMDAYSYICRDGVFANAQTGNILLLGVNLSEGKWIEACRYIGPIAAFSIGIGFATILKHWLRKDHFLHWRQIALLVELALLFGVGLVPRGYSLLANSLTSMACGIQVQSFRKIKGNAAATTMCIGNLRSATEAICNWWYKKDKEAGKKGLLYIGVIVSFAIGAIFGNVCIKRLEEKAIMVSSVILFISFLIMFIDLEGKEEKPVRSLLQE